MDGRKATRRVYFLILGWLGVLAAGAVLGLTPIVERARVVRALAGAAALLPEQALRQPFLCQRPPLEGEAARELRASIWEPLQMGPDNLAQARLRLAGGCLLGEYSAGLTGRPDSASDPYLRAQMAVIEAAGLEEERLKELISAGLDPQDLLVFARAIATSQIDFDIRPLLRELGRSVPQETDTWQLWIQTGVRLEQRTEWEQARDWFEEGQALQVRVGVDDYTSSFELHIGRFYQSYSQPRQPQTALGHYNLALVSGLWRFAGEEASAHLYRGEVYRTLKETYTPAQALDEFEQALAIDPQSYWAEIAIGNVYFQDLKNLAQAETYYQQALAKRPDLPYACYYLGELYRLSGDKVQAEAWFRQALAVQPDFQPALERIQALEETP